MHEHEVQGRTAAVPEHDPEQLPERASADQPCDSLVLDQRLPPNVARETGDQQRERS